MVGHLSCPLLPFFSISSLDDLLTAVSFSLVQISGTVGVSHGEKLEKRWIESLFLGWLSSDASLVALCIKDCISSYPSMCLLGLWSEGFFRVALIGRYDGAFSP